MRKRFVQWISLCIVMIVLCGVFGGCNGIFRATRSIVDMAGNEVEIPIKVNKIYVDWTDGIILPMTLGATKKLVVAPSIFDTSDYTCTRTICPDIDRVKKDDEAYMSIEKALSYKPDLVITSMEENVGVYQNEGVAALYVEYSDNESFQEALKIVGKALGEEEYALAKKYCEYVDSTKKMIAEQLTDMEQLSQPSIYYMDGRYNDIYHTVGKGTVQEDWIRNAGGNLTTIEEFEGKNLEITTEKMLQINPEIILISGHNRYQVYDMLMSDATLLELKAVKNKHVYCIPRGLMAWDTAGPENSLQMIWAAKLFYPKEFADLDIKTEAAEFYQEIYHVNVSGSVLDEILNNK